MKIKLYYFLVVLFSTIKIIAEDLQQDLVDLQAENIKRGLSHYVPHGTIIPGANGSSSPIIDISHGGTGIGAFVPYALLAGGTTTQSPIQQVSVVGNTGQGLAYTGSNTLPSWSNFLPGYAVSNGFLFAGRSTNLSSSPDDSIILSADSTSYGQMTSSALGNIFLGTGAGSAIVSGTGNIAFGTNALQNIRTGLRNICIGENSGKAITTTSSNVGIGVDAFYQMGTGSQNTAIGDQVLPNFTSGSNNVALGALAGSNLEAGSNNIYIGHNVAAVVNDDSNTIVIGNSSHTALTYIRGISGATSSGGITVYVNSNGQLGTIQSSRRFKENIEEVVPEVIDKLQDLDVVEFNYIGDESKELQYGMIAEDVEQIFPEMIVYDKEGKINTIQYHKLVPLLIKECQTMRSELVNLEQKNIELQAAVDFLQHSRA